MIRSRTWVVAVFSVAVLSACSDVTPTTTVPSDAKENVAPVLKPTTAVEQPAQMRPSWPTYHGSSSLDGVVDVSLPDTLALLWRVDVGAAIENSPVISEDRACVVDAKGVIHAFDLSGKPVWSKSFQQPATKSGKPRPVYFDAPLALFDSTVIAGSTMGVVYALDAASGELRWECNTESSILGSPNFAEVRVDGGVQKRVYVIDESDGALQCLDFATGKLLWRGNSVDRCDGSPAVNDSVAVYGSCACALHVFSTSTGELIREIPLDEDSQIAGGVVLLGDLIFSGSRSGKFVHANAKTGETLWVNTDCVGESFSTPAVNADRVLFSANDSTLYALDRKTGTLQWKCKLEDTPLSPVIARDKVVVSAGGSLYLLRLSDGERLWSFPVSDGITSPSLAGALVIVGGDDGTVTAFASKMEST